MTPQPKDPAKMTDAELIEAVAKEVRKWRRHQGAEESGWWGPCRVFSGEGWICDYVDWNPIFDWNHWREVEEKIMEDDKRLRIFLDVLEPKDGEEDEWGGWHAALMAYLKADLRTRCVAAILAVRSASPNSL